MILAILVLCQCARARVCVCVCEGEGWGERDVVIDSFIYPFSWLCITLFIVKHFALPNSYGVERF